MVEKRGNIFSGFVYKFFERVGVQGVSFVISMLLARMLMPEEYGIIALVTVIITLLDVFITYGFGNSLVVDRESSQTDFSTCFYFSVSLSVAIYIFIFIFTPQLTEWLSYDTVTQTHKYDVALLSKVIRLMALHLPIAAVRSVQNAYVQKNMLFSMSFQATLAGTIIAGVAAVIMAYNGAGVWALVAQYLGSTLINTVALFLIVRWRPTAIFSFNRLKKIYQYGWKILCVGLLDVGYSQLRSLIIAKRYSATDLAYYNKGYQFPATGMDFIESTMNTVLFSALSQHNDNKAEMAGITGKIVRVSTYVTFPIMMGLFIVAEPLVIFLLTDKWAFASRYLQIGCLALILRPLQVINSCIIRSSGRSGLLLFLDIVKKGIGLILLIVSVPYGVEAIAFSLVIINIISTLINIIPSEKLVKYGLVKQIKDLIPNAIITILMGVPVYLINYLDCNNFLKLGLQVIVGILLYIALSIVTSNENFKYLFATIKRIIRSVTIERTSS